mgnify:CR=1 FL=1
MYNFRTDLADERADNFKKNKKLHPKMSAIRPI